MTKTATLADVPNNGQLAQTGEIKMWPTSSPPVGYLLCDGSAVSRTTYAALFALIGTTFGAGDGSSTFGLPNYTDRTVIGAGGLYSVGATGGSKDATLVSHSHTYSATTSTESADHSHSGTTSTGGSHQHGIPTVLGAGGILAIDQETRGTSATVDTDAAGSHDHTITTGGVSANHTHSVSGSTSTDGSSATDANLPPYLGIRFIIKT